MSNTAIIIGPSTYHTLGVIRSCGEAGVGVYVLLTTEPQSVRVDKSRYVSYCMIDVLSIENVQKLVRRVKTERNNQKIALIPTGDAEALLLDQCGLKTGLSLILPGAEGKLEHLMDKQTMAQLARLSGLHIPKTQSVNLNKEENESFSLFPCIVKPLASVKGEKGDITVCYDETMYIEACNRYKEHGCYQVLVQEYIREEGITEIAVPGVRFPDGTCRIAGVVRKRRISGNGSTCYASFEPVMAGLPRAQIEAFLDKSGYYGIFDIEFLQADSNYYFIECNYRNGAYGYAVTCAGINLPALWATGGEYPIKQVRSLVFMEERSDALHALHGNLSKFVWLWQVLRCDVFLTYQLRDYRPVLRVPHFIKRLFS